MSLVISTKAELIKTKRSAAFWLSVIGGALIPVVYFTAFMVKPDHNYSFDWQTLFLQAWQVFNSFLLPMFVILVCSLVPQIEYKNNAWKQVFASPQSIGNVFFAKYLTILFMIIFLFILFNLFLIVSAVGANLIYSKFHFLHSAIDWKQLAMLNARTFISLLAIISIQYLLSLRFRNFIVPIGIGLGLLVISIILVQSGWEHMYKVPYAFPLLTMISMTPNPPFDKSGFLLNHEWNALLYFAVFTVLAFLDVNYRKERG